MKINLNKINPDKKTSWIIFIGIFIIALSFAVYTSHTWEDFYITYRVSKNLATGHGLVYTIGEKVHAFTSPLNTLIPAALNVITGNVSDELVLWLFRLISIAMLGAAAVLLYKSARKNFSSLLPIACLIGMFGMDAKIIDFSINGQEVAFMMFFLALILNTLTVPSRRSALKLGLALAGLMWTRPDGFIYAAAIFLGFFLFEGGRSINKSRLGLLKIFVYAGIIAGILYLPWFLWAWYYFGSPIPHTITSKGFNLNSYSSYYFSTNFLLDFISFPLKILRSEQPICDSIFFPGFVGFGGWHYTVTIFSHYISCICALYWFLPFGRPQARAFSFAFMLSLAYFVYVTPGPASWYIPNATILAIFVFAHIVQQGLNFAALLKNNDVKVFRHTVRFIQISTISVLAITLVLTLCSAYQLRIQQREIEDGNRKQIGLWLRQNAASTSDSVFTESLGYIGFFSQLKMLDYPGLSSTEVMAARKKLQTNRWEKLIPELHPDWLVLRPGEANAIHQADPNMLTHTYYMAKAFDVSERIKSYRRLPGRQYVMYDQTFLIFGLNKKTQ